MSYLTDEQAIRSQIAKLAQAKTIWMDTEVADYQTKAPRLSLIQVLDDTAHVTGDDPVEHLVTQACVLDVLDRTDLVAAFIEDVMANPAIEKIFHNSRYDVQFLGKTRAKNVTCTLQMAKTIPYYCLPIPNRQLKTLASALCQLELAKEEQGSDWGQRPLTQAQLNYAKMDPVYLAKVHACLLTLCQQSNPDPASEDLAALAQRHRAIQHQWKLLDTEINHLQERLKQAMQTQSQWETEHCRLASTERSETKVLLSELATLIQAQALTVDFPVTLTKQLQQDLATVLDQLPLQIKKTVSWRLIFKDEAEEAVDE